MATFFPRFLTWSGIALTIAIMPMLNPAPATAARFECHEGSTPIVVTGGSATTSSKAFVDLAGSTVNFDNGGDCLRIEFFGKVRAQAPQALRVRVLMVPQPARPREIDNDTVFPASMDFYVPAALPEGKATSFYVRQPVTGARTLKLQFLSVKGGSVTLDNWSAVLHYESQP